MTACGPGWACNGGTDMLEIGKSYTIEQVVTPEMTARAIGSGGLEVFGTPFMICLLYTSDAADE